MAKIGDYVEVRCPNNPYNGLRGTVLSFCYGLGEGLGDELLFMIKFDTGSDVAVYPSMLKTIKYRSIDDE